jgi:hypothetical protein
MALGSVQLQLYCYTGTVGSFTSADLKYTINKNRIGTENNIVLEIGELVRDHIEITFNDDYTCHAKWVTAVVYYKDLQGDLLDHSNPGVFNYLAVDGYGFFEDEINPELSRNALITSDNIYLPEGTAGKLPIFAEGVGKVRIDSSDTQITDSGNSNQKIQYVTIPANSSEIKVYDTDDTTLLKTITVTNICEPKFTSYKLTFVNRYGAFEDFFVFKKSIESFDVVSESYKANTINRSNVLYSTAQAQKQITNVNATTKLTVNTGFIKENMNTTVEELLLSENIYIRYEGKTLPLLPLTKSMTHKTHLNDKMINYTIEFEFAFDKINNIR